MNIDDLTIGQAKQLAGIFGTTEARSQSPHIGKKCIIRTYASGVHFGRLEAQNGREVELSQARRIWRFDVKEHGVSLSEVAVFGPTCSRTKICCVVPEMTVLDALEIIPCTPAAVEVIEAAEVFKP